MNLVLLLCMGEDELLKINFLLVILLLVPIQNFILFKVQVWNNFLNKRNLLEV